MDADLKTYSEKFRSHLIDCNRDWSLRYIGSLLERDLVTVPELYEQVLAPALNSVFVCRGNEEEMIWREHVMTGIVRSAVEMSFPYVLSARDKLGFAAPLGKVMLACPEEEYHELGARMGADFYTIAGYDAVFIGANTPVSAILSAASTLKPTIVNLSVSNYLNLVQLNRIVEGLRAEVPTGCQIFVSGSAFRLTNKSASDFGADGFVNTYADLLSLRGNVNEGRS